MEKSFLFDVVSRIYVATDSNPVHMATYELCCDMIDVAIDVSCIYGVREEVREASAYCRCSHAGLNVLLRVYVDYFECRVSVSSITIR